MSASFIAPTLPACPYTCMFLGVCWRGALLRRTPHFCNTAHTSLDHCRFTPTHPHRWIPKLQHKLPRVDEVPRQQIKGCPVLFRQIAPSLERTGHPASPSRCSSPLLLSRCRAWRRPRSTPDTAPTEAYARVPGPTRGTQYARSDARRAHRDLTEAATPRAPQQLTNGQKQKSCEQ